MKIKNFIMGILLIGLLMPGVLGVTFWDAYGASDEAIPYTADPFITLGSPAEELFAITALQVGEILPGESALFGITETANKDCGNARLITVIYDPSDNQKSSTILKTQSILDGQTLSDAYRYNIPSNGLTGTWTAYSYIECGSTGEIISLPSTKSKTNFIVGSAASCIEENGEMFCDDTFNQVSRFVTRCFASGPTTDFEVVTQCGSGQTCMTTGNSCTTLITCDQDGTCDVFAGETEVNCASDCKTITCSDGETRCSEGVNQECVNNAWVDNGVCDNEAGTNICEGITSIDECVNAGCVADCTSFDTAIGWILDPLCKKGFSCTSKETFNDKEVVNADGTPIKKVPTGTKPLVTGDEKCSKSIGESCVVKGWGFWGDGSGPSDECESGWCFDQTDIGGLCAIAGTTRSGDVLEGVKPHPTCIAMETTTADQVTKPGFNIDLLDTVSDIFGLEKGSFITLIITGVILFIAFRLLLALIGTIGGKK